MKYDISPINSIRKTLTVPGDKSISHRSIMFGALANGDTFIRNFLESADCISTINCFRALGIDIEQGEELITVHGKGLKGLVSPKRDLFAGNSGTTIRLMLGILCAQEFPSRISGDSSICKRPMDRVIAPLQQMGAKFYAHNNKFAPVNVFPTSRLTGTTYASPVSSAQVKSAVLLAGLYAEGVTTFTEPAKSRDHSERMLKKFGVEVEVNGLSVSLKGKQTLHGTEIFVPSDISSAAFFMVLAAITPDSEITIQNVGLNPTRTGIIDVLKNMNGNITISNIRDEESEPIGDITVSTSHLKGTTIGGSIIPALIDEIPVIAVAACFAEGTTIIKDAQELKIKESNRIHAMYTNLKKMGADITETDDGLIINGGNKLKGCSDIDSFDDHRIIMSMAVAALNAEGNSSIDSIDSVKISFPNFFELLK